MWYHGRNVKNPVDNTCTCTRLYCTGKVKGGKPGWMNQRQTKGNGYSHYGLIKKRSQFIRRAARIVRRKKKSISSWFKKIVKAIKKKKAPKKNKPWWCAFWFNKHKWQCKGLLQTTGGQNQFIQEQEQTPYHVAKDEEAQDEEDAANLAKDADVDEMVNNILDSDEDEGEASNEDDMTNMLEEMMERKSGDDEL
jgi:hypothetical protein